MPAQTQIIYTINILFKQKGLELNLETGGICGGLASVYLTYALDGREDEFFELYELLANPSDDTFEIRQSEINKFIYDIELAYDPSEYGNPFFQGDLEKFCTINQAPLSSQVNIGMIASEEQWTEILANIYQDGSACYVGSHCHAIAVSFKEGKYRVFDPNYGGIHVKVFSSPQEVIKEFKSVFDYEQDEFGLSLRVFSHPQMMQYQLTTNYAQLFDSSDYRRKKVKLTRGGQEKDYNQAHFALYANDMTVIKHLVDKECFSLEDCKLAIGLYRNDVIHHYIKVFEDKENVKEVLYELIKFSTYDGSDLLLLYLIQCYELRFTNADKGREQFKILLASDFDMLYYAAQSASKMKMLAVIDLYEKYEIDYSAAVPELIKRAVSKGNSEVLELVYQKIDINDLIRFIRSASENNHTTLLKFLLKKLDKDYKIHDKIFIDKSVIEKISPKNLKQLGSMNI